MLVLSRKKKQAIVFPNHGIRVVVLEQRRGGYTRLGIEAPDEIRIIREELLDDPNLCDQLGVER